MLNKTKLGLTAAAALFSVTAFAAEDESHLRGFFVEIEGSGLAHTDASAVRAFETLYYVQFCEKSFLDDKAAGHHCVSKIVIEEVPTFIPFNHHHKNVYLKQITAMMGGYGEDGQPAPATQAHPHISIIQFDRPFAPCSMDPMVSATGNAFGDYSTTAFGPMTGYGLLEISLGQHEYEPDEDDNVINCDNNSIYFPIWR